MSVAVLDTTRAARNVTAHPWPVRDETIAIHDVVLENGTPIERVDVRFRLEGQLNAGRDNLVVVVHALTGTPDASDWWKGVIGDGEVLDPRKHAILCANLLGGCAGTSGPRTADDTLFPAFSTRDQAMVLKRVIEALGVAIPLLICGGSLGGMVTLEFAAASPTVLDRQSYSLLQPLKLRRALHGTPSCGARWRLVARKRASPLRAWLAC